MVTCVPTLTWFDLLKQAWLNTILPFLKKILAWDGIGGFLVTTLGTN